MANELISKTAISHHLSTGFIRASIRHLLPEEDARVLARHAFDAWEELPPGNTTRSLLRGVARQADLLRPSIKACVQRAAREGIGLVVEGSHLLPGLFDPEEIGADLPRVAMSVALGDQWTNLIQPLALVPVLTIAGLGVRHIMGYTFFALLWSGLLFTLALIFF